MGLVALLRIISLIFDILYIVIIADIIISWIPSIDRYHPLVRGLRSFTAKLYAPARSILPTPRFGGVGIDFAPMVTIIGLWILEGILRWFIRAL